MSPTVSAQLHLQVHTRAEGRCEYCQTPEELTVTTFELDHIVPLSAGGATALDNLCLACPACNRYKAARQSMPDPETGQSVPLYHPWQQEWSMHFTWSKDATQIVGLTPTGRATVEALQINRPRMVRLRGLWMKIGRHPTSLGDAKSRQGDIDLLSNTQRDTLCDPTDEPTTN
jgi:hypothetical protein